MGSRWGLPAAPASYTINDSYNVVIRLNLLDEFEYRAWLRAAAVL